MRQSYSKPKVGRFLRHGVITRNSSEDQTANVNFFTTTPTTISTQCAPEATEFGEITQNKGHYVVQGYSRSQILVPYQSKAHLRLPISD